MEHPRSVAHLEKVVNEWAISCQLNELFKRHRDKIWRCPSLMKRIVDRCRSIFMFTGFCLQRLTIRFQEEGPTFDCLDGGRSVYPSRDGSYASHNIDNPDDAFCLYLCLQAALDEIDEALEYWDEGGGEGLVEKPEFPPEFQLQKGPPYRLYKIAVRHSDKNRGLDQDFFVWTDQPSEAHRRIEIELGLFDATVRFPGVVTESEELVLILRPERHQ